MSKFDKTAQLLLLTSELITWLMVAKYQSPIAFITVGIMIIVIDIIVVDMSNE